MMGSLQCVVLDCPDVAALASFYQAALGGVVNQPDPRWSTGADFATLHAPGGVVLAFQRVSNFVAAGWPDPTRPQQLHLDIDVPELDDAHERVVGLGARFLRNEPRGWRVYADPAGHPFCLIPARHQADIEPVDNGY
jgi:catechol 2,3-dioxygenase-like lactoylglutathione lyase family enzyme